MHAVIVLYQHINIIKPMSTVTHQLYMICASRMTKNNM